MKLRVGMKDVSWDSLPKAYKDVIEHPEQKFLSVSQIREITGCSEEYITKSLTKAGLFNTTKIPNPSLKSILMNIYPADKVLPLLPHPTANGSNSASELYSVPELAERCKVTENAVYCYIKKNGIKFSDSKKPYKGKKKMLKTISNDNAIKVVEHFKHQTATQKPIKEKTYKDDPDYAEFLKFKKWMKIQDDGRKNFDLMPDVKPDWVNN